MVTIDEPIFGRRKRDLYRAGDETILDENEIEISDDKIRADTRVRKKLKKIRSLPKHALH